MCVFVCVGTFRGTAYNPGLQVTCQTDRILIIRQSSGFTGIRSPSLDCWLSARHRAQPAIQEQRAVCMVLFVPPGRYECCRLYSRSDLAVESTAIDGKHCSRKWWARYKATQRLPRPRGPKVQLTQ